MQLSSIENITKDNILFHEAKEFQLRNTSINMQTFMVA